MSGKRLSICLVGAGRMGARWAKIFSASRAVRLLLVVDPDPKAGKRIARLHRAGYAASLTRRELDAHEIDAVFVVTPHLYLYPNAERALASGRHVFCEKPGSTTSHELQSLFRLAKKKKRRLMVGFNYRYFSAIGRAKKLVDSGKIGKLLSISIRHGHTGRRGYGKEWRMDKRVAGGGVLMDQGVHVLDLVQWFLGSPIKRVSAVLSDLYWKAGVEDSAFVVLKDAKNRIASVWVSICMWKPTFVMEVVGTKGYCVVNGVGRKYGGGEKLTIGTVNKKNQTITERTVVCDSDPDKCLREELSKFVKLTRSSRGNIDDPVSVLKIVEKSYGR